MMISIHRSELLYSCYCMHLRFHLCRLNRVQLSGCRARHVITEFFDGSKMFRWEFETGIVDEGK
jgi:hypothetical protein